MASESAGDYDRPSMTLGFRAVFFGTPEIAVPALRALHDVATVVGVVSQPDRPAGRGMQLKAPAVKEAALELGLEVFQPLKVRTGELEQWVRERTPDVALVMAYGRILPLGVLAAPRLGCLNLHASLLPRYRGAAPIQRAIMSGETETGIALMQMEEGLDTGPVFTARSIPIGSVETAGELAVRLAALGDVVTREDVPKVVQGVLRAVPQEHALATHAPPLTRADGALDWTLPAEVLVNRVRGLAPRPGAHTAHARGDSKRGLKVLKARVAPTILSLAPGEIGLDGTRVLVGTGSGLFEILEAQLEGKRALSALDLVNGRSLAQGDQLMTDPVEAP